MDRDEGWNVPFAMGVVACPYLPLLQACHPLSAHNQSWVSQVLPWAWGPKLPGAIYYMGKKNDLEELMNVYHCLTLLPDVAFHIVISIQDLSSAQA